MSRFSALTKQHPVAATFEFEGESVTITFDRNRMTQNWARSIQDHVASDNVQGAAEALFGILLSWDVVDDNDQPLPISMEILGDLPIAAIAQLDKAIGEYAVPSSEEGNASTNTLASPAPSSSSEQGSRQNGPEPSPLPQPSASLPTR